MLLLTGASLIVTMDASRRVLTDATVVVDDSRGVITGLLPAAEAAHQYPDATVLDCDGGWITPGYVNAHQHLTGDRLARCTIPDHLPSGEAIFGWAVPLHAHHQPADDELSALASCVESLRNGVTTVIEAGTVAHPERVGAAMKTAGIRGSVGTWGWDIDEGPFAAPAPAVLDRLEAVLDAFPAQTQTETRSRRPTAREARVTGWVTLVGHDLMSDELLCGASELARRRQAHMTFHISPTHSDPHQYLARTGLRPLEHFERLGVLGEHLLLAHAVHLDDSEVELLLMTRTAIASCPWAYLRLGQGFSRAASHGEIVQRGGRLALGCDSENAGDQLDVLRAASLFAGLVKDAAVDPAELRAVQAFELATVRGAGAVGLGQQCGSIEVGKCADLVVHDVSGPNWSPPGGDPYLQLVWGTDGRSVRHVLVDGEVVVRDCQVTTIDERELAAQTRQARGLLLARAGLA